MTQNKVLQDRYKLIERIGAGGMAEVWLARDERLGRDVAVKFLDERLLGNPESHVRFFTEAQAAARISHPNVVKVLDFGQAEDIPYLVMEYVPGGTLAQVMGEPMDVSRALDLVGQAALGASALHAEGLVHRDLKPANILLDSTGRVKITDLGIAAGRTAEHMTETGAAIGSPHYISPEQVAGKDPIPASDVYSLGVVLYEALTGEKPFTGDNLTAIAIAHVDQEPEAPISKRPDLPPEIDALVLRCMAKDPAKRFADGSELVAALSSPTTAAPVDGEATGQMFVPAPAGRTLRARIPAGAMLVLLLLFAGAAVVAARMGTDSPEPAGIRSTPPADKKAKATSSPSPSPSSNEVTKKAEPSPSPTPEEEQVEKKETASEKKKEKPAPEEEPEPEPSPEPSAEPSPEPTPEETAAPEAAPSPSP